MVNEITLNQTQTHILSFDPTGKWVNGEFVNPDNKQDTFQFRIATFLINIIVIGFMLSVIGFWLLKFLKVI